jgi:hypothetical protein
MKPKTNEILWMTDGQGQCLGQVVVENVEEELLLGQFTARPEFASLERLFAEHEDLVNHQVFSLAEEMEAAIEALRLTLRSPDGRENYAVEDVQIMRGHDLSCRLSPRAPQTAPAAPAEGVSASPFDRAGAGGHAPGGGAGRAG